MRDANGVEWEFGERTKAPTHPAPCTGPTLHKELRSVRWLLLGIIVTIVGGTIAMIWGLS